MPACTRGELDGLPNDLGRDRLVGAPAVLRAGEEIRLRAHPAVVLAEGREERRAERHLPIDSALPAFDADDHPLTIDMAHLQMTELAPTQAGAIERHQHRAVKEIPGRADQPLHFVRAQDRSAIAADASVSATPPSRRDA